MARLIEIGQHELNPTLRALSDAGATTQDADWIRQGNAGRVVAFIHEQMDIANRNPFQLSVPEILKRLREASEKMKCKIGEDVYEHLEKTAPAWPKGRLNFLSLRIRFGEGDEGVAKTFEAHADIIRQTFEPKFCRWELLLSGKAPHKGKDVERLRLLGDRNASHKPVIEWCTFDLDANRKRKSITAVHGSKPLADEGLVFTWLFREYAPAIDYDKNPGIFFAGYESNVPEFGGESWQRVPCVDRSTDTVEVDLSADWRRNDSSGCSVPTLEE